MIYTLLTTFMIIICCIFIHYEILMRTSMLLEKQKNYHRMKVLWAFVAILACHLIEILLFAAYYIAHSYYSESSGLLLSSTDDYIDYIYYSFVIYTSLGLGDIIPVGDLRLVTGLQSLVGLLLIAWSASYMFFQMENYWKNR